MRRCVDCFARWKFVFCVSVRRRTIVLCASMLCCQPRRERGETFRGGRVNCLVRETVFVFSIRVLQLADIGRRIDSLVCETCLVFCFEKA